MWATQGSGISEQPINKQVIDHLSDGQSDPNRTDNRRTIKAEHDSSSFLSAISPRTSLSNALLYLSLVSLPSSLPPSCSPSSAYEFPLLGAVADGQVFSMQPPSRTEPC